MTETGSQAPVLAEGGHTSCWWIQIAVEVPAVLDRDAVQQFPPLPLPMPLPKGAENGDGSPLWVI